MRFLSLMFLSGGAKAGLPESYPSVSVKGVGGRMRFPLIGMGTWLYNETVAEAAVALAFKVGYRHIDTAVAYDNHKGVGAAIAASGLAREEIFVTTKLPGELNASATEDALRSSLVDLRLDYVDMMLIHWPGGSPEERKMQWLALESFAKAGKARAIGVSHYCRHHLEEVFSYSTLPVALNQNQYHVGMGGDTQPRLHDKAFDEAHGVLYMSYSTLCGPCDPPHNMELITGELVSSIGAAHNKTGAQVALRWVVQQGIPVIPKSRHSKYLRQNFDIFDFNLTASEMARLSAATSPPETGTIAKPDDAQECPFRKHVFAARMRPK
mmetsp:Transcript_66374/g.130779  ORF Transcript_66374/g.130779 Transcript_66374/m.130779 type:complete len:324 (-) Transcript_66374:163-1134(-)